MNVLFSLLFVVVADGVGSGRLSMVIYRKAGLFLSSLQSDDDDDDDDSTEDDPLPELNSAIISATLPRTPSPTCRTKSSSSSDPSRSVSYRQGQSVGYRQGPSELDCKGRDLTVKEGIWL